MLAKIKSLGAMKFNFLILTLVSLFSMGIHAGIPNWYKRDLVGHLEKSDGVILYKVTKITQVSVHEIYYTYRIDTETLRELKGTAPKGECYMIHSEGEWESQYEIGQKAIVILNTKSQNECGTIEPGFGVPATQDYIDLFSSILTKSPNQSKY